MNKEELKELGETLIGISHGEPWQFRKSENFPDSRWVDAGMMADPARILKNGGEIRLKPSPDIVAEQQEVEAAQDENSSALQTVANSRPEIPPYRDSYTASH